MLFVSPPLHLTRQPQTNKQTKKAAICCFNSIYTIPFKKLVAHLSPPPATVRFEIAIEIYFWGCKKGGGGGFWATLIWLLNLIALHWIGLCSFCSVCLFCWLRLTWLGWAGLDGWMDGWMALFVLVLLMLTHFVLYNQTTKKDVIAASLENDNGATAATAAGGIKGAMA